MYVDATRAAEPEAVVVPWGRAESLEQTSQSLESPARLSGDGKRCADGTIKTCPTEPEILNRILKTRTSLTQKMGVPGEKALVRTPKDMNF